MATVHNTPTWLYKEFQSTGVNYEDPKVSQQFEKRHRSFRDFNKEFEQIKIRTGLKNTDVVLDLGCGTGAFVIPAAKYCRKVYAVDVSKPMLGVLQEKIAEQKFQNVEVINAGFLTYQHTGEPIDVVVSSIALHHLPDYWKAVALDNISKTLKPGGVLYLFDVVFNFDVSNWQEGTQRVLDEMSAAAGHEADAHISSEFSTFNWIQEGILERTGFKIEQIIDDAGFLRAYVCRKIQNREKVSQSPQLTVSEARSIDAKVCQQWNMPTLLLMENAGRSLAEIFLANAPRYNKGNTPKKVLICCGKGNNGGDGFVLARRLSLLGLECQIVCFARQEDYQGDALTNLRILQASNTEKGSLSFHDVSAGALESLKKKLEWCDWIVDALLGSGAYGALRTPFDQIIPILNASSKPIYAVDIPSGLNADTGEVVSDAVKAQFTTTLATLKIGLLAEKAKEYVGELFVGDIGVPITPFLDKEQIC